MPDPDLVAAALSVLPPGIRWAWLVAAAAAALGLSWLWSRMAALALLRPLRQARQAAATLGDRLHWTEEARLAWPLRRGAHRVPVCLAFVVALVVPLSDSALDPLHPVARALLLSTSCLVGGWMAVKAPFAEALPALPQGWAATRGSFASLITRFGHLILLLVLAVWLPGDAHPALILAVLLLATAAGVAWRRGAGVDLSARLRLAHPADARLMGIVAQAAARLQLPMPRVQVLDWMMVNAFAFPGANRLVFTRAAVERLDDAALGAITLHELGHLAEGPQLLRLRALQPLLLLPVVALKPAWFHLGSLGSLGFVLLWFVGVLVARRFLVARMQAAESAADSVAGQGHDNEAYARVLEQIYVENRVPAVLGEKRVHPELYDRMRDLGVEPDWPRPDPPSLGTVRLLSIACLLGSGAAALVFAVAVHLALDMDRVGLGTLILSNSSPRAVMAHGRTRAATGQPEAGAALMRLGCNAAAEAVFCAEAAMWSVELGRCAEARQDQEDAEWLLELDGESIDAEPLVGDAAYVAEGRRWVEGCGVEAAPVPTPRGDW